MTNKMNNYISSVRGSMMANYAEQSAPLESALYNIINPRASGSHPSNYQYYLPENLPLANNPPPPSNFLAPNPPQMNYPVNYPPQSNPAGNYTNPNAALNYHHPNPYFPVNNPPPNPYNPASPYPPQPINPYYPNQNMYPNYSPQNPTYIPPGYAPPNNPPYPKYP